MRRIWIGALLLALAAPAAAAGEIDPWQAQFGAAQAALQQNEWADARDPLELALRATEAFPANDERTLKTLEALLRVYQMTHDPDLAVDVGRRALSIRKTTNDTRQTADLLFRLSSLYRTLGEMASAETMAREELALRESLGGPADARLALTLTTLADIVSKLRLDDEEAEALYLRGVALGESHGNPRYSLLAHYYGQQRRHAEASETLAQAIEHASRPESPDLRRLAHHYSALARHQTSLGLAEQARQSSRQALDLQERLLGEDHPSLGWTAHMAGATELTAGRFDRAREDLERALALTEKGHGDGNPCGRTIRRRLAEAYTELGLTAEAQALGVESTEENVCAVSSSPEVQSVAERLHDLMRRRLFPEALQVADELLALTQQHHGHDSVETSRVLDRTAYMRSARGELEEALELYRESLDILERILSPSDPRLSATLSWAARILDRMGRQTEAEEYFLRKLTLLEASGSPVRVAQTLAELGSLNRRMGTPALAEGYYREAAELWLDLAGPDAPEVTHNLRELAACQADQAKYAEAESVLLELLEETGTADERERAVVVDRLRSLYREMERPGESEEMKRLGDEIRRRQRQPAPQIRD